MRISGLIENKRRNRSVQGVCAFVSVCRQGEKRDEKIDGWLKWLPAKERTVKARSVTGHAPQ